MDRLANFFVKVLIFICTISILIGFLQYSNVLIMLVLFLCLLVITIVLLELG